MSLNADGNEKGIDGDDNSTTPKNVEGENATAQSDTMLSRLRTEATKRLQDLQRAEDAADEALLKFGGNVRDFLKDAISIAPPDPSKEGSTVLFESKDSTGKRVIHTSRFDAQLHVIHTSASSLAKDDPGPEFAAWAKDFDVEKKTADISTDLEKYPDLRATMEKLVPDQVAYVDFWKRYYFLRHGVESAESRRRELLKDCANQIVAASTEDEVGWDDDSDEEDNTTSKEEPKKAGSVESSTTIHPPAKELLKPSEQRRSNDEKSQADSEASYDVVGAQSGLPSQAATSPKETKKDDDSDDDWE
ncbi:hypothetical protein Golomagni_06629 [Golovinomyces magnicellulatus]|nr:hypothetical protein Golomagni_06629 [Golovinomyces magnicellulatus]